MHFASQEIQFLELINQEDEGVSDLVAGLEELTSTPLARKLFGGILNPETIAEFKIVDLKNFLNDQENTILMNWEDYTRQYKNQRPKLMERIAVLEHKVCFPPPRQLPE